MVRNNQSNDNRKKLDGLLRSTEGNDVMITLSDVISYAGFLADIENVLVVVSDLSAGKSSIVAGRFAGLLGLEDYSSEDSIWESRVLSLMTEEEQEEKYAAELRFYHYLRKVPKSRRPDYYLMSRLRFRFKDGDTRDVIHKMYYVYEESGERARYAVCTYGPLSVSFPGKSCVVNSLTGVVEELSDAGNDSLLSKRERQVLSLIDMGMRSAEIAERLHISIHTVSRHRQEIIGKLHVKSSLEACRVAKTLHLL